MSPPQISLHLDPILPDKDSHNSFDSSQALPTNEQVPSVNAVHDKPSNPPIELTSPQIEPTNSRIRENQSEAQHQGVTTHKEIIRR